MKFTNSEENYLKSIFHLQMQQGNVSTNTLAATLKAKPASITDMTKKLNAKKLLHYKPYYGFYLSTEGRKAALEIIRRHRLWEAFLAEKLEFQWDDVHEIAEELEHISSKKLIDKLDAYLGFPKFDPHGDPIPDNKGKIKEPRKISLLQMQTDVPCIVCQVGNDSAELLELLKHKKISIGSKLSVKKRFEYDHSLEIKINQSLITISNQLAKNVFVTYES